MRRSSYLLPGGLFIAVGFMLLPGCGGGGGGGGSKPSSPTPTPTPAATATPTPLPAPTPTPIPFSSVGYSIVWASRTVGRATASSTSSARSAVVSLTPIASNGTAASMIVDRQDESVQASSYTQAYTFPSSVASGSYIVEIDFYADPGGTGDKVATATATQTITGSSANLATVAVSGVVVATKIVAGQSVKVGEQKELSFSAYDANGRLLGLSPGSATWSVASGGKLISFNTGGRVASGLLPGNTTVVATVDGKASDPGAVTVTSDTAVSVTPDSQPITALGQQTFTATVTGAPDSSVIWSVVGTGNGTITSAGVYTAPNLAGTYQVTATSVYDPNKSATVTVPVTVGITMLPLTATLTAGDVLAFHATVVGSTNTGVVWSIAEGANGGTVTSDGVYTAPLHSGVYHLTATSSADPNQTVTSVITVQTGGGAIIIN